jgi:hypothetical protein
MAGDAVTAAKGGGAFIGLMKKEQDERQPAASPVHLF